MYPPPLRKFIFFRPPYPLEIPWPSVGGSMDIFWNHTLLLRVKTMVLTSMCQPVPFSAQTPKTTISLTLVLRKKNQNVVQCGLYSYWWYASLQWSKFVVDSLCCGLCRSTKFWPLWWCILLPIRVQTTLNNFWLCHECCYKNTASGPYIHSKQELALHVADIPCTCTLEALHHVKSCIALLHKISKKWLYNHLR